MQPSFGRSLAGGSLYRDAANNAQVMAASSARIVMKQTWQTFFDTFMLPQERSRRLVDELHIGFVDSRWALTQTELQPNFEGALVLTEHRLMIGWIDGTNRQVVHLGHIDYMSESTWDRNRPEIPYQAVLGNNREVAIVVQTASADERESTMLSDLLNEAFIGLK